MSAQLFLSAIWSWIDGRSSQRAHAR